jgi:hypothetical protein
MLMDRRRLLFSIFGLAAGAGAIAGQTRTAQAQALIDGCAAIQASEADLPVEGAIETQRQDRRGGPPRRGRGRRPRRRRVCCTTYNRRGRPIRRVCRWQRVR